MKKLELRFWEKVEKSKNGCWNWISAKQYNGYGVFWVGNGVSKKAHRISYEMKNGKIPDGMYICHKCDNPGCVNPEHLFVGTASDNAQDMSNKKRGRCNKQNGSDNHISKLSENSVIMIRILDNVISDNKIAQIINVTREAVRNCRQQKVWKHVCFNKQALA